MKLLHGLSGYVYYRIQILTMNVLKLSTFEAFDDNAGEFKEF
jgi:hypothetical protein